jgi:MFS family permease
MSAPAVEPRIEESLNASRREGVVSQVSLGALDFFLIPFALFLGASAQQIGWLVALPHLLAASSQFFVVDVVKAAGNRKRLLVWAVALQSLLLAPLPALAILKPPGRVSDLLALICAFRVIGAIMAPPWGSLMSDYLPETVRGRYFGKRSQEVGLSGMLSALLFGSLLYFLKKFAAVEAFAGIFAACCASRAFSLRYFRKMADLPEHHTAAESFDWAAFLRRLKESNFARFVAYECAITFASQLSAAYFSVHMLRDLRFDYMSYVMIQLAPVAAGFLSFPLWGRHADLVGNAKVLRLNSFLLPVIPLLWCLTESFGGLLAIELASGFLWAGFNLCTANFMYEAVPAPKRVRALGYFNLFSGAALFSGGALGGWLADRLPPFHGYRLHSLFLLAAMARLGADFVLSRHFADPRPRAPRIRSARLFFSVIGVHPLVGPAQELEWDPPRSLR